MTGVHWLNLDFADRKIVGVRVGTLLVVFAFVLANLVMIHRGLHEFSLVGYQVGALEICLLFCWAVVVPGQRIARGILSYLAIVALILALSGSFFAQLRRSDWSSVKTWVDYLRFCEGGEYSTLLPGCMIGLSLVGLWIA